MTELITVDSPDDPRLRDYTDLTDVELRRRREPAEGLFIAEGEKVIRRAVAAGYAMRSMVLSPRWVDAMREVIGQVSAPIYVLSEGLVERVTGYHVHRGALASMRRKPLPTASQLLESACRVAILESVNDHTNVGAIFRSAAALGMDAVLLSSDCADPFYRRSVKVSMGAVFAVPHARLERGAGGLETVRQAGFTLLALTPDPQAVSIAEVAPHRLERVALMVGAEGEGLSKRALTSADTWLRIPMAHEVDSLNVGAAAAVAFYAMTARPRQSAAEWPPAGTG